MTWTSVEFFETGDGYFDALKKTFAQAQRSILLEFYIFAMDRLGQEMLGYLCEAEQRGVKVFLRLDGVGAREDLQKISAFCGDKNIELEIFHPLPFESPGSYFPAGLAKSDGFFTRWRLINRRTHRKIVIVDEKIAFTGGMNIKEYQSERHEGDQAWHDLSLKLEGPGVEDILHAFWFRPFKKFSFRSCLPNYSWRLRQERNSWISKSISSAKNRVWVITPYFSPTPTMIYQLRAAAKRGVDIRIVLTKKSDIAVSRLAALGLYRKMLARGIRLFEYGKTILHRKLWVIDDISVVGSSNLNHRSFIHDLELDVILREPQYVNQAVAIFVADERDAVPIGPEYLDKFGFKDRVLSWIAGWFSYWL